MHVYTRTSNTLCDCDNWILKKKSQFPIIRCSQLKPVLHHPLHHTYTHQPHHAPLTMLQAVVGSVKVGVNHGLPPLGADVVERAKKLATAIVDQVVNLSVGFNSIFHEGLNLYMYMYVHSRWVWLHGHVKSHDTTDTSMREANTVKPLYFGHSS